MNLPEVLEALRSLGFYRYCDADQVMKNSLESGNIFSGQELRSEMLDVESFSDSGPGRVAASLYPLLRTHGLKLSHMSLRTNSDCSRYAMIDDTAVLLSQSDDSQNVDWSSSDSRGLHWSIYELKTARFLDSLSARLGEFSAEKIYLSGGGNDMDLFILTAEMKELIVSAMSDKQPHLRMISPQERIDWALKRVSGSPTSEE